MDRLSIYEKCQTCFGFEGICRASGVFARGICLILFLSSPLWAQLTPEDIGLSFDETGKAVITGKPTQEVKLPPLKISTPGLEAGSGLRLDPVPRTLPVSSDEGWSDDRIERTLSFPDVKTMYVWDLTRGKSRTLLGFEVYDKQSVVSNVTVGHQYVGFDVGYKIIDAIDVALAAGYGYDFDDSRGVFSLGIQSKLSLLKLGRIQTFSGYDFVQSELRYGIGVNVAKKGAWMTNLVFDPSPFVGVQHAYNLVVQGDVNVGIFVGYDFSSRHGGLGAGLGMTIRF